MEFVKVIMHVPFGRDAYIECYIQINNNEKEIEILYLNLKDEFSFEGVYSEEEVDAILRTYAGRYSGQADVEQYVKLSGKLKLDTEVNNDNPKKWWKSLISYVKDPEFENISEKVVDSEIYKVDRVKYTPENYKANKNNNVDDLLVINI